MNKLLVVLLLFCGVGIGLAADADEYVKYQTWDRDGFKMYFKASSTETAARYNVTTGSITLILVKGTTYYKSFLLTDASISTFKLFQSSLTALSNLDTTTHSGSWIVSIPEDVDPYTPMTALEEVLISSNCFGVANTKQFTVDSSSATRISFTPPVRNGRNIKVKYAISNVTATSPNISIVDVDNTALTPTATMTSDSAMYFGVEDTNHPIAMSKMGESLTIRVNSSAMTAGYLLVGYTIE